MRHFVFALMIVLLPLRGWMGDAMAYSMLGQGTTPTYAAIVIATNSEAQNDLMAMTYDLNSVNKSMQTDFGLPCHGADAAADTASTPPAPNACTACQVCHLTASLSQPMPSMVQLRAHAPAALPPALWVSADLSVLTKPPVL